MSDQDLQSLKWLLEEMELHIKAGQGNVAAVAAKSKEFHIFIRKASGSKTHMRLLEQVYGQIERARKSVLRCSRPDGESHGRTLGSIYAAMERRNARGAGELMLLPTS